MRWLGVACVVLGVSCRPRVARPSGDAGGDANDSSAGELARAPRFSRPVAALRVNGATAVVARDRATALLTFTKFGDDHRAAAAVPLPAGLDEPELLGSSFDLGLLARATADAADGRALLRISLAGDAGSGRTEAATVGSAACSTADGVYSLSREATGWRGSFFPLTEVAADKEGPLLAGRAQATIVCGQHRAFVVLSAAGELRAAAWTPSAHEVHPVDLPKPPSSGAEEDTLMAAMGDKLVIAKLERSTLHTLVWPDEGSDWRRAEAAGLQGLALEALEPGQGQLGLLFVRTTARAKGCPRTDVADAVAEVALVDAVSGQFVHAPESVETWRCGAEPGPFFSGWADGNFLVAWPRGADAACVRAGVRRGGLGYAEVDRQTGRAHVGRVMRPAETIVEAGCDAMKCYAVALTRGADACGAADGPDSGRLEIISYPP